MKPYLSAVFLLVSSACITDSINAATVNISFSGDITDINDPSGQLNVSSINSATTFNGIISYDNSLDPFYVGPSAGGQRAFYSPTIASISIEGFDFSVAETIVIDNYAVGKGADKLWKSTSGIPSVSNCIGDFTVCSFNIKLWDTTGEVFSDTSLPTNIGLNDFNIHNIEIKTFLDSTLQYQIDGNITSLSAQVVPIPASLWLFGSGALILFGASNQRRPNKK